MKQKSRSYKDYVGNPIKGDSLPHPPDFVKWLSDELLELDVENMRIIAGPKAQ